MSVGLDLFNSPAGAALLAGDYAPFLQPTPDDAGSDDPDALVKQALLAAMALRELGFATDADRSADDSAPSPIAADALAQLHNAPLGAVAAARLRVEASRIENKHDAYAALNALEQSLPGDSSESPDLYASFHLARGVAGVNARAFESVVTDFEQALPLFQSHGDARGVAETQFQFGRFRAWQGREDLALPLLEDSLTYWKSVENRVMAAHVRYELANLWIDRRNFQDASEQFDILIADYKTMSVAPGVLIRAQQRSVDALIGQGRLDEAQDRLAQLPPGGDTYRQQMILRNRAEIALQRGRKEGASDAAAHFKTAGKYIEEAMSLFEGEPSRTGFTTLTLRGLHGDIIASNRDVDLSLRLSAVDLMVRSAAAFSDAPNERPHEIRWRLAAIAAYLDIAQSVQGQELADIHRLIGFQVGQVQQAAGKIGLVLNDPEAKRIVANAEQLASVARDRIGGQIASDMTLMELVSQDKPLDFKLEVMARLVEALQDQYELGLKPAAFRPSEVLVKAGGYPLVRPHPKGEPESRVSTSDRAYLPPEIIAGKDPQEQSDFYVVGAVLLEWLGGKMPINSGPGMWLRFHRMLFSPGRPPKSTDEHLSRLVGELMDVSPKMRPDDTYSIAARLRAVLDEVES